jgi:hypothetical protein
LVVFAGAFLAVFGAVFFTAFFAVFGAGDAFFGAGFVLLRSYTPRGIDASFESSCLQPKTFLSRYVVETRRREESRGRREERQEKRREEEVEKV